MKTLVIIDDEPDARAVLRELVSSGFPEVQIVAEADGVAEGIKAIQKTQPDIVFLDIKMRDGTGFDLLQAFPNPAFHLVFVTAFDTFALKAFRYNALNYLLKPVGPSDLAAVFERIDRLGGKTDLQQQIEQILQAIQEKKLQKIVLTNARGMHIVQLKDLSRLESKDGVTTFHTTRDRITVAQSIGDYEDLTETGLFFRVHQSHIVNLDFVRSVSREDGGFIIMEDNSHVPLARRRRDDFLKALTNKG